MKKLYLIYFMLLAVFASSQEFSTKDYLQFREDNDGISDVQLQNMYARPSEYYFKGFEEIIPQSNIGYLNSMKTKLELTDDELALLNDNLFFVTERLKFASFGEAFQTVYNYDLPIFITTDAILHALHVSYDQILEGMERNIMSANLDEFVKSLYDNFEWLEQKYSNYDILSDGLKDADIYVTIAYSLITDQLQPGHVADEEKLNEIWEAVNSEKLVSMSLFTNPNRKRNLDFSQFTVRGHYVYEEDAMLMGLKSLEPYFRTMMWLGRTDFLLTPPPLNPGELPWTKEEILRMNTGAFMVNELVQGSEKRELLQFNEQVINYLVGKSDNITLAEYQQILDQNGITSAEQLTDTGTFNNLLESLNEDPELGQKILSDVFFADPNSNIPENLPLSYRVSGQRFIIDSYILGNLVYDRIVVNGEKIWRPLPKTLDAIFTLGNNDALPLLKDEFEKYPYAGQLANLRYLVDHKSQEFWQESLYNVWLNSIRKLNPLDDPRKPLFMKTAAWRHEKINTQLASWSQLRHDNLLYAKQSYTWGIVCSFPKSYVEPYPEFYGSLKKYAKNAESFFSQLTANTFDLYRIKKFFSNFAETNAKLEELARKELENIPFTEEENDWLKSMLYQVIPDCGDPPFTGWYIDLFFDEWDATESDYTVVDVHTQPTDRGGNMVGKVLHAGVGEVNLGVFLVNCPDSNGEFMAFAGPVLSYYEKITENFKRLTDQEWEETVENNNLPGRPDWTNIYMADENGNKKEKAAELPSKLYTGIINVQNNSNNFVVYPNPVNDILTISYSAGKSFNGYIKIYNSNGVLIKNTGTINFETGQNHQNISLKGYKSGMYILKVDTDVAGSFVYKVIKK